MRLGFIGTGTIASAVVEGIAGDGHQITVSERSRSRSADLAARFGVSVADNQGVVDASDVLFLGLLPDQAATVLPTLRFHAGQRVISFIAGVSLETLAPLLAPATPVALMLPFPGISKGGSPIISLGKTDLIDTLFTPANSVYSVENDAEMMAYLAAQAVLSPAVKMVADAAQWIAPKVSDPALAEDFLRVLVGSNLMSNDLAPLLQALSSPGGYNARLREHMDAEQMPAALRRGLEKLAESGK
ncbi:NAD(P)-binding domain-containing protein [Nioella sediminis]|jgi:pyrroline-5-carboxylate reductase|uniref:NAD(P)-binding domain-containing protein n=1 Tax=Nioella sediminis TaxID=1912092 RepID=UPI0008FD0D64|nr:NAD(P)-binding domain-containing protein [Nioella sediminis]TBX20461.1 pyrroline-5-carboxylate reductase [Roseovarius sp. JS7-11]